MEEEDPFLENPLADVEAMYSFINQPWFKEHCLAKGTCWGQPFMMSIQLTRGYEAQVSPEDYERINSFNWSACVGAQVRAVRQSLRRTIYMQHEVLGIMPWELDGKQIDHIDRNTLNNRQENLRVVSRAENMRNTLRHQNRRGYCWHKRANLYLVYLDEPGKARKYLGYTKTEAEAQERVRLARG